MANALDLAVQVDGGNGVPIYAGLCLYEYAYDLDSACCTAHRLAQALGRPVVVWEAHGDARVAPEALRIAALAALKKETS